MDPAARPLDVVVVGGGVAGLSLLWALARRGARVALCERGRVGAQGASSVPAALLNPHRGRSGRASAEDLAGLAAFWGQIEGLERLGLEPGARRGGVLRVAGTARQARAWRRLEGVRWLEPGAVPAPFRAPHGGFVVAAGGWVAPARLLAALASAARGAGAELREGCGARGIERRGEGWLVATERGPLAAARVALCVGADRPPAGPAAPALERVAGEVVALDAAPLGPGGLPLALAGSVYAAEVGGRVHVGGNHRPPERPDPAAPRRLQASAARAVPALAAAAPLGVWRGVRARRPGNEPLVTELEPGLWWLGALAGRGFLRAALEAERLAERLGAGRA